jgi:acetolactate synthase-1/2/3 large subunit
VVAFRSGRGVVSDDSEVAANIVSAYELWPDTDLLIGIGTRLEVPFLRWPYRPAGLTVARIDIDPREMERLPPDVALVSDSKVGTSALLSALQGRDLHAVSRVAALQRAKESVRLRIAAVKPHAEYLERIREILPRDGLFVEELCQAGYVSYYGFPVYAPRTYISCGYQGTLGFGFMTALGAKLANPDKAVVSITGDGGFMFGVQELATAVQYGIAVVTIVFDNSGFGNVRRDQQQRFGGRIVASELRNPDFVRLAESFGALGVRAQSPAELATALDLALRRRQPAIIHVPVDPESEVSPWPLILPRAPKPSETQH